MSPHLISDFAEVAGQLPRPERDVAEAEVRHEQIGDVVDEQHEAVPGRLGGHRLVRDPQDHVDVVAQGFAHQHRLVGETPVHGGDADPGVPRDVVEPGAEPVRGEDLPGGADDAPAVLFGVTAQRARSGRPYRAGVGRHVTDHTAYVDATYPVSAVAF